MTHGAVKRVVLALLAGTECTLLVCGVVALVWLVYVLTAQYLMQWRGRDLLQAAPRVTAIGSGNDLPPATHRRSRLRRGTPLAPLSISRLSASGGKEREHSGAQAGFALCQPEPFSDKPQQQRDLSSSKLSA